MKNKLFFVEVGVCAKSASEAIIKAVHPNKNIKWVGNTYEKEMSQ